MPTTHTCAEPLAVELFREAARRLGLTTRVLDHKFGYLWELSDGRGWRCAVVGAKIPINDAAADLIAADKYYQGVVLTDAGRRAPRATRCLSPRGFADTPLAGHTGSEPAREFAALHGFPLVVKPNSLSHGRGVQRVDDLEALLAAVEATFELDRVVLVQELVHGREFRFDFLEGELLIGYERAPLVLHGDGVSSVAQLLERHDRRFDDVASRAERLAEVSRTGAWRELARSGHDLSRGTDSVLPAGTVVDLSRGIMNLNRCATARAIESLPAPWLDFARELGELFHLRHLGVDLRVESLDADPRSATIIEINSAPLVNQIALLGHRERAIEAQMKVLAALTRPSPFGRIVLPRG